MRLTVVALVAGLSGCTTGGSMDAGTDVARAALRDADGRVVAQARARQADDGLRVAVEATGVSAGVHGIHVHMVGRCDPPGFESAGGHWNPTSREHGMQNPRGPHFGDLPNLTIDDTGRGSIDFRIEGASLRGVAGLLDEDGAALVVHAGADDLRTDPSGNSGARIACGVFR